jgi:nucleotide-binding universal stress UspA family protein
MMMRIRFRHLISSLTLEIEKYIKLNNIDLVVMGTNGEGDAIFGSNTQKVVRLSPVPVIALRTAPAQVSNIALAVSSDQYSDEFVQQVKQLQTLFQATLHLVYINTPALFQNDADSNSLLAEFADHARFSRYTTSIRADYSVEAGLINFAKETNADMIAMGTHGWKGLAHLVIGSTAENIVNNLKVPIWTLSLAEKV